MLSPVSGSSGASLLGLFSPPSSYPHSSPPGTSGLQHCPSHWGSGPSSTPLFTGVHSGLSFLSKLLVTSHLLFTEVHHRLYSHSEPCATSQLCPTSAGSGSNVCHLFPGLLLDLLLPRGFQQPHLSSKVLLSLYPWHPPPFCGDFLMLPNSSFPNTCCVFSLPAHSSSGPHSRLTTHRLQLLWNHHAGANITLPAVQEGKDGEKPCQQSSSPPQGAWNLMQKMVMVCYSFYILCTLIIKIWIFY